MKLIFVVLVANRDIKSTKIIEIGSLKKICHARFIAFFTPILWVYCYNYRVSPWTCESQNFVLRKYLPWKLHFSPVFLRLKNCEPISNTQYTSSLISDARQVNSFVGDHSFGTYAKISKKLTFITFWYAHVRVRIRGYKNVSFPKILRTY